VSLGTESASLVGSPGKFRAQIQTLQLLDRSGVGDLVELPLFRCGHRIPMREMGLAL
jgi:hypothetical protein